MGIKNTLLWSLVGIYGVGLMFNHQMRNDYYQSFSYLFNQSSKQSQDYADISRLLCSILIMSSFLNIFNGYWFRVISMISFVFYYVVLYNQVIIKMNIKDLNVVYNMIIEFVVFILGMDSIINSVVSDEMQKQKQHTTKVIQQKNKLIKENQTKKLVETATSEKNIKQSQMKKEQNKSKTNQKNKKNKQTK